MAENPPNTAGNAGTSGVSFPEQVAPTSVSCLTPGQYPSDSKLHTGRPSFTLDPTTASAAVGPGLTKASSRSFDCSSTVSTSTADRTNFELTHGGRSFDSLTMLTTDISRINLENPRDSTGETPVAIEESRDQLVEDFEIDFPPKLGKEQYDAVLIYCEDDAERVIKLKDILTKFITLEGGRKPKFCILDRGDNLPEVGSRFKHMEVALYRSTYMFLFITKDFIDDSWGEMQKDEVLMESITEPDKKWCAVPLFPDPRKQRKFTMPFGLRALKGVDISHMLCGKKLDDVKAETLTESELDPHFLRNMTRMLNERLNKRLQREKTIELKRWEHAVKEKERLVNEKLKQRHKQQMEQIKREKSREKLAREFHQDGQRVRRYIDEAGHATGAGIDTVSEWNRDMLSNRNQAVGHPGLPAGMGAPQPTYVINAGYVQIGERSQMTVDPRGQAPGPEEVQPIQGGLEEVDDYEYVVVERPGTEDQTAAGPGDPEPPSSQPRQMASFSSDSSTQSEHGKMASFPSTDTTQPPYSGQYYLPASYGELRHSESSMLTKGYPDSYPLGPYQYYPGLPPGPYYPQPYPPGSVSGMEEPVKGVPGIHDDNQYPGGHVVPLTGHWQGSEDKSASFQKSVPFQMSGQCDVSQTTGQPESTKPMGQEGSNVQVVRPQLMQGPPGTAAAPANMVHPAMHYPAGYLQWPNKAVGSRITDDAAVSAPQSQMYLPQGQGPGIGELPRGGVFPRQIFTGQPPVSDNQRPTAKVTPLQRQLPQGAVPQQQFVGYAQYPHPPGVPNAEMAGMQRMSNLPHDSSTYGSNTYVKERFVQDAQGAGDGTSMAQMTDTMATPGGQSDTGHPNVGDREGTVTAPDGRNTASSSSAVRTQQE